MQRSDFFGRKVMWAVFTMAVFGWGVGFYGPPIFLHAVMQRTGWPLSLVSGAVTLHFLAGTLVVANLPRIYARFGIARVTFGGSLMLALGIGGWAVAATPWQLLLAALFSGMGWVTLGAAAVNALIAPWFVTTRPAALGMAYNGASLGGVLFSPLWVASIATLGFGGATLTVGLSVVAVIGILAWHIFIHSPESLGQRPDGETLPCQDHSHDDQRCAGGSGFDRDRLHHPARAQVQPRELEHTPMAAAVQGRSPVHLPGRALWRNRQFITLALGMSLGLFAQIGLITHLFSLLIPRLGGQWAGIAMGVATLAAIGGRILVGRYLRPGTDRRKVACCAYALQVFGSLVLLAADGQPALLWLGVVLFGSGIGNATSLPPLIAQLEFADAQRAVSLIVALSQACYAFGPALFGLLREASPAGWGGAAVLAMAALIQSLSIISLALGRRVDITEFSAAAARTAASPPAQPADASGRHP
ncbi:MFS transporter [Stutzerimonas azotifigens]|uniref:MFS transporter n=1 Tax=Stutzerimonas azotifigens TaxID=291995 RepID=A0ABR5YX41_9GAMM|nr:MFS transporter [Stutzerimonas azotifigens]MBA1272518.1 MFS transporter [Stutzerimonas azotifigens]